MEVGVLWDGYSSICVQKNMERNYILLKLFSSFESIKCADLWKIMARIGFEMKLCFLLFQITFEQLPNDLVEFLVYS